MPSALKGIYRLEGDLLTVCHNPMKGGEPRPTTFASEPGSGLVLGVFERQRT